LEVTDRIDLSIENNAVLKQAADAMSNYIKSETLTDEIHWLDKIEDGVDLDIDGITAKMKLEKKG
jgi:isoleucyl-tRNA synthetase